MISQDAVKNIRKIFIEELKNWLEEVICNKLKFM